MIIFKIVEGRYTEDPEILLKILDIWINDKKTNKNPAFENLEN